MSDKRQEQHGTAVRERMKKNATTMNTGKILEIPNKEKWDFIKNSIKSVDKQEVE